MDPETFEANACDLDLHTLSHRGLNQELIPCWLESGEKDLDGRIESSAYGETPPEVQDLVIEQMRLDAEDTFLDLGAGGGGVLARVLGLGVSGFGIEQNRLLVEAGRRVLQSLSLPPESLIQGDFLTCPWPAASKLYAATSRYSQGTLTGLALRIHQTGNLRRVVTLGKELDLPDDWSMEFRSEQPVRWNCGEARIMERLCCWVRA